MQKIAAWAGNAYFASHMRSAGYHVVVLPRHLRTVTWTDVTHHCGTAPDVFVYGDCSVPPFLRDIESFPCPTIFYAIDTHIHSWYPRYAQGFDLCCVAMRDHLPSFAGHRLGNEQIAWLPLFAKDTDRRIPIHDGPRYDVVFVGKNDPLLTPGRHKLLQELAGKVPLTVLQGRYDELYSRSKLVLNISEHGDLNFRVFEVLGCGACLITPRVGHGLRDLFSDGKELFTYDPNDITALAALVRELLADDARRLEVAEAGLAAVDGKHRAADTAEQVAAILGVTKKHIDTRVRKERWKSKKRGDTRVFVVGDLPQDIQAAFQNIELVTPKDIRKRLQRVRQVATILLKEVELIEGMLGPDMASGEELK